jgi:hypothetical protein
MPNEKAAVTDSIEAVLNPDPDAPSGLGPDAKGPDPEQWPVEDRETSRRKVDRYSSDTDIVRKDLVGVDKNDKPVFETVHAKGPHPDEWGPEARAERGAETDTEG